VGAITLGSIYFCDMVRVLDLEVDAEDVFELLAPVIRTSCWTIFEIRKQASWKRLKTLRLNGNWEP
jgi:hypothetical protein